jgi:energy-coupling factor transport system ATP-binding protein
MSITVKNINYTYSKNTPFEKNALKNVSIEIEKGKMYLFIGHTGSGKSTLINCFNGLIIPDSGEILIENINLKEKSTNIKEIRKKVGIIFQYPESQFFLPTVKEEIEYACKNFNVDFDELKLKRYFKLLGLSAEYLNKSPFNLSGGEMRKIAILSVLMYDPDYIIFDEPTVGLDYSTKKSIFETIKKLNEIGKTIILITHWISDFLPLKPKVLMLKNSEVFFKGSFDNFVLINEKELENAGIIFDDKLKLYKCALLKDNNEKEIISNL